MEFPSDIEALVTQYTWAWRAPTHPNWREGSSIIAILQNDPWWQDYIYDIGMKYDEHWTGSSDWDNTWIDWCKDKMIIGPPRRRSDRELTGLDEDYMSEDDVARHYIPWAMTWTERGDHSWCKVRDVPDWAKEEYIRTRNEK
jgi:hypothetical protein